ncbi:MAG: hypothetical protein ABEJ94_01775 [Halorientalis sp.]
MAKTVREAMRTVVRQAGPGFAVVTAVLAIAVPGYAVTAASLVQHRFVHLVTGILWTGTDLLIGVVVGPVIGRMETPSRIAFLEQFVPRLVFFLPMLLIVAIGSGVPLAMALKPFPHAAPWLALFVFVNVVGVLLLFGWRFDAWHDDRWRVPTFVATTTLLTPVVMTLPQFAMTSTGMVLTLTVGTLLVLNGFGLILSANLRSCLELQADDPDETRIVDLAHQLSTLTRVQVLLQFLIVLSVL